jgi:hypothetical protein
LEGGRGGEERRGVDYYSYYVDIIFILFVMIRR